MHTPKYQNTLQITKYKLLALIFGRPRPAAYRGHEKISSSILALTFTNCTRIIVVLWDKVLQPNANDGDDLFLGDVVKWQDQFQRSDAAH